LYARYDINLRLYVKEFVFALLQDWELHQDVDGNIMEVDDLRTKIFKGGVEHNIRSVWLPDPYDTM
jgi:hypothetical protein